MKRRYDTSASQDGSTRVPARAHAGCVGIAIAIVVLPVLVQAIERPAAGPHEASATVDRNQAKHNGGEGFAIGGDGHTVTLNISESNGEDGFTVSATGSTFQRNVSSYNGRPRAGWGILQVPPPTPGASNTYSGNNCTGNGLGLSSPVGLCR